MAKTLSKTGITTGNTVKAFHVTQSVDAFTGIDDYDITISGSLTVTGSITGQPTIVNELTASYAMNSLSSSYAVTASYAENAGGGSGAGFPFTGSAEITGSLAVIGPSNVTGSFAVSSSGNQQLTVEGSGSSNPILVVNGSLGEMFSISDSLSGSLFSVNDISGTSILEVFSDDTVTIGNFAAPVLHTSVTVNADSGDTTIYDGIPTSSYNSAFFEYTAKSASNARSGKITSVWIPGTTNITSSETTSPDIGNTLGFRFGVVFSGENVVLTGSATSNNWVIKTSVRAI
tara:strand:- start:15196 stop:16059 length:864 start_codon:yes stop_codon:yes gene_type:complete